MKINYPMASFLLGAEKKERKVNRRNMKGMILLGITERETLLLFLS